MKSRVLACVLAATFAWSGCSASDSDPNDPNDPNDPGDPPGEVLGCSDTTLLENPSDPSATGPWAVGARTVTLGRLTVEVWYPAKPGSADGASQRVYDIRDQLPPSQQELIPDADNPWQACDCFDELPIDDAHGPYPVVLFVHGTASFRTQSLVHMTHWASRGFVVLAADHPGLRMADTLALLCPDPPSGNRDLAGDANAVLDAVEAATGELSFLAGRVDTARMAAVGHSAGGGVVAGLAGRSGVRVVMPWSAGSSVSAGGDVEAVMFVSGMNDAVARYDSVVSGYSGSMSPRHLVGIADAGHLVVSDLCDLRNAGGENILETAQRYDVCGTAIGGSLFDCEDFYIDGPTAWPITNYATSALLETVLHCTDRSAELTAIADEFDALGEYKND